MKKDEEPGYDKDLHKAIHTIVENQIKGDDPKEVKDTLKRLMDLGYTRHESIHKIGTVVLGEIYEVEKSQKPFNRNRFVNELNKLK
ncbi:MAG: DUF1841 family protein [Candidatus Thermoplasmatota archaeon]|nr:DUF1841 family protein [Candidatus Thermoplasmatota archaeon]